MRQCGFCGDNYELEHDCWLLKKKETQENLDPPRAEYLTVLHGALTDSEWIALHGNAVHPRNPDTP